MESTRVFYDGMDNDPADYNDLQGFVQSSMEHIVEDGISSDRKFAGFQAAITGAAEITCQPGRLYSGGKVYDRPDSYVKDFTTQLPVATKKNVLLVIFASEVDTDARPREFLINEETGASEPRVVALERRRVANINVAAGTESPDPIDPILDSGVLAVARVVLSPTGVTSVEMLSANRLDSVASVAARTASLEVFRAQAAPQIVSLGSDLASLRVGAASNTDQAVFGRLLARLAVVEETSGIPAAAADSDADFFLDTEESDLVHASFLAKVAEGVRFADDAANETSLNIFNALDANAKIVGGVMLPAYTRELRMTVGPRQAEAGISAYTYQTNELIQKTMSRLRLRYGWDWNVSSGVTWWGTGYYDYYYNTYAYNGELFNDQSGTSPYRPYYYLRQPYYWYDTVEETYWDRVTIDHAIPGAQIAETFLNSNDLWLDAVGLTFTRLAATGGITLSICETTASGTPDLNAVVSVTTVARSGLSLNAETVIPIQPTFLEGGKRYAIVIITAADHWVATTQGENFPQGTFFYVLDGAYQQGDGTRDLCFSLYACKFNQSRAVITMAPLSLSGGITSVDILADAVTPDSTKLTFEVQVGSAWLPLGDGMSEVFGGSGNIPPLVPLRLVYTGTPDVMPAVKLTGSRVRVSRPRTSFVHISTVRTLPASSTQIRVIARLENFESAHHTATGKIRTGAGYTTVAAASSVVDSTLQDGSIERTWLFNLGSGVTSYKIQLEGTTDSALNTFNIGLRKDYAL